MKKIIKNIFLLGGFFIGTVLCADVTQVIKKKQFNTLRRKYRMFVVYFYNFSPQEKNEKEFKRIQKNARILRYTSENKEYEQTGIRFSMVNRARQELAGLALKYGITEGILLFYRGTPYSSDPFHEKKFMQSDIESYIDDNFGSFMQQEQEKKERPQALYNPNRDTIYEYGRPIVYAGPTWGYYYSPFAYDPYWNPGRCGYGYGPYASVGFSFSTGYC